MFSTEGEKMIYVLSLSLELLLVNYELKNNCFSFLGCYYSLVTPDYLEIYKIAKISHAGNPDMTLERSKQDRNLSTPSIG